MGAILLIEDDRNVQGLIEKIFPKEQVKVIQAPPRDPAPPGNGEEHRGPASFILEGEVRRYLKEEIHAGHEGSIHEAVLGKVERILIGMLLEEEKGNQVRAAKRLGINRNTLRKKMKDFRIIASVVTR